MSHPTAAARRVAFLQARRQKAADMFEKGFSQTEVAREVGVTPASACRWHAKWKRRGQPGLRVVAKFGRPVKLTDAQVERLKRALVDGAMHHGFGTDLWTLPRIAQLVDRLFGVRYHPGHVWRVMHRLGWSLQRPTSRARERDEEAIASWRESEWEKLKKGGPEARR
jgi:transposase